MTTMSSSRATKARAAYFEIWGRYWPNTNAYLSTLWKEVKIRVGLPHNRKGHLPPELGGMLLDRMRETDPAE